MLWGFRVKRQTSNPKPYKIVGSDPLKEGRTLKTAGFLEIHTQGILRFRGIRVLGLGLGLGVRSSHAFAEPTFV